MQRLIFPFMLLLSFSPVAYGYVGPGLGVGTLGVIIGVIVSIFLAIFAIIWYPLKRLFKKRKPKQDEK